MTLLLPEVVSRIDPEFPPVHVESAAIDSEGSRTLADAIFRVRLRDGSKAIVYALLEHKSRVNHRTPLQLIRYVLKIWAMEMDGGAFPDGCLPLTTGVFYGREPWTMLSAARMHIYPACRYEAFLKPLHVRPEFHR